MSYTAIKQTEVYKFAELSESSQDAAIQRLWDINADDEYWYESTIEDAKTIGALMGIHIANVRFRGFSSQGDGACFEGSFRYATGSVKAVRDYTGGTDPALESIALALQRAQSAAFYTVTGAIRQRGRYQHSGCTEINLDHERGALLDEDIRDALRSFMDWIYGQLEKEYDYQTSRERIIETIDANDYEFTENGELY